MFGLKKTSKTIGDLDNYLDYLDECVLTYKSGIKNYLEGNKKEFDDNLDNITRLRDTAVKVEKARYGYMVNDTICETGEVYINGAMVRTINSESTEIEDIKKTIADCGLEGVENINYLQAIKRVIGMINKPLAN